MIYLPLFGRPMYLSLLLSTHRFLIILWISRLDVNNGFYICEGERTLAFLLIRIFNVLYFLNVWKYHV